MTTDRAISIIARPDEHFKRKFTARFDGLLFRVASRSHATTCHATCAISRSHSRSRSADESNFIPSHKARGRARAGSTSCTEHTQKRQARRTSHAAHGTRRSRWERKMNLGLARLPARLPVCAPT